MDSFGRRLAKHTRDTSFVVDHGGMPTAEKTCKTVACWQLHPGLCCSVATYDEQMEAMVGIHEIDQGEDLSHEVTIHSLSNAILRTVHLHDAYCRWKGLRMNVCGILSSHLDGDLQILWHSVGTYGCLISRVASQWFGELGVTMWCTRACGFVFFGLGCWL